MRYLAPSILLVSVLAATSASAALMEADLMTAGDGLITVDDQTSLEWLDLTATQGLSVNQALGTSFVTDLGFRHASAAEVNTLFLNAGFLTTNNVNDPLNDPAAALLLEEMGCTQLCGTNFETGRGFADNGAPWMTRPNYHAGPKGAGAAVISLQTTNRDLEDRTAGHFLVRAGGGTPMPEPSAAVLFLVGGVTLRSALRRRR